MKYGGISRQRRPGAGHVELHTGEWRVAAGTRVPEPVLLIPSTNLSRCRILCICNKKEFKKEFNKEIILKNNLCPYMT